MQSTKDIDNNLFNIFNNTYPAEGVALYLEFVQKQLYGHLPTIGSMGSAIVNFKLIEKLPVTSSDSYNELYKSCLLFQNSRNELNRNLLLLAYLGEMICFWFMRDYNAVRTLQQEVSKLEFNSTWWERNKKTVAGIGGALLGAATMLAGGGSAGVGGVKGGQIFMDNVSDIEHEETKFNELRDAICRINFRGL